MRMTWLFLALLLPLGAVPTDAATPGGPIEWSQLTSAVGVFSVKAFGAIGDGSTDDTTAINAAITAAEVNGGTVLFPPASYGISSTGLIVNSQTQKVNLTGYGATLKAIAAGTTLLTLNNEDNGVAAAAVYGLNFNCNSQTGTNIGLLLKDNVGSSVHDFTILGCSYGVRMQNVTASAWTEGNSLYDGGISNNTVAGIDHIISGGGGSFDNNGLYNLGLSNNALGIHFETGSTPVRYTMSNVVIWLFANQTAMQLDALFWEGVRWQFNIEAFATTGTVGVKTTGTFSYGASGGTSNDIEIGFTDDFPVATPFSGTEGFTWRSGSNKYSWQGKNTEQLWSTNAANPAMAIYPATAGGQIWFGDSTSALAWDFSRTYGSGLMTWNGTLAATLGFQAPVVAVASLPACNGGAEGTIYGVNNATATTFNSTVAAGGSNHVQVYCNGTNWVIGG